MILKSFNGVIMKLRSLVFKSMKNMDISFIVLIRSVWQMSEPLVSDLSPTSWSAADRIPETVLANLWILQPGS